MIQGLMTYWLRTSGTYGDLILDTGDVEEGLDLLPQLPPGPGAELQVFAQVALDNLERYSRKGNIACSYNVDIDKTYTWWPIWNSELVIVSNLDFNVLQP